MAPLGNDLAQAVNDHDFRSQADGIAIPYGVYDLCANRGFVVVGTSHDTPDFAADNSGGQIWWQRDGLERYRDASELLMTGKLVCSPTPAAATPHASVASSMLSRPASPTRTTSRSPFVTTPAARSKSNPIDHRLFSEISKNWAGHPLRSYQTILNRHPYHRCT